MLGHFHPGLDVRTGRQSRMHGTENASHGSLGGDQSESTIDIADMAESRDGQKDQFIEFFHQKRLDNQWRKYH